MGGKTKGKISRMPVLTGRVIFQYFYDIGGEIDL